MQSVLQTVVYGVVCGLAWWLGGWVVWFAVCVGGFAMNLVGCKQLG